MSAVDEAQLAKAVGRAIARCRQASQLTQEDVAERLGIGNEAVSRMERGVVIPTVVRLVELADIFQCDAADLLTESSNRPADQASHIGYLLERLDSRDRELVIDMVEKLTHRLAKKGSTR